MDTTQSYKNLEKRVKELEKENAELKEKEKSFTKHILHCSLPVDDDEHISFEDLFDLSDIQRIQDQFSQAAKVAAIITRVDGTPITEPSNFCRLCKDIIRKSEKGCKKCVESDAIIGRFHPEGPTVQACLSSGLYDAGAAISVGGKHIASLLIGQVRDESHSEEQMLDYARKIGADERDMVEAFREIPVMSREQFEFTAQFVFTLANQLSRTAYQNLQMVRLIKELRQTENALREKETILQNIHTAAPIGIYFLHGGHFAWVNQKMNHIVGYSDSELLGKSVAMLHPDRLGTSTTMGQPDRESFDSIHQRLNSQIAENDIGTIETIWRNKKGALVDVLINATSFGEDDDSRRRIIATVLDISDRKKSEKALLESEEKFRVAFHTSPDAISIARVSDGVFIDINGGFTRILGYSREELVDQNFSALKLWKNPAERRLLQKGLYDKGYVENLETEVVNKNGKTLSWLLSATLFTLHGEQVLFAVAKDISERKKIENELKEYRTHLEDLVRQRTAALESKNKEMETFTYSVSHDLKAPLRGIDGYSRLLEEDYAEVLDGEGRHFLKNVRQSATQMNQLIEDLLAYSRMERRDLQPVEIDLLSLTNGLIAQRSLDLEAREIVVSVDLPFQTIHSDIATVRHGITNFLDNAVKFSREEPPKTIEISGKDTADSWTIWVKDNGIGFNQQYSDRIFEIFQRLHRAEDFPGTGIGLAIVKKAIERVGGRCWAESSLGEGAIFFIEIPKSFNRTVEF